MVEQIKMKILLKKAAQHIYKKHDKIYVQFKKLKEYKENES
jgi:hypothetical protein